MLRVLRGLWLRLQVVVLLVPLGLFFFNGDASEGGPDGGPLGGPAGGPWGDRMEDPGRTAGGAGWRTAEGGPDGGPVGGPVGGVWSGLLTRD